MRRSPAPNYADARELVAVAVDSNRRSQHALKWAADHLLSRAQAFFLLHVRRKLTSVQTAGGRQFSISHVQEDLASSFVTQMDLQTKVLLLPFECFCNRRRLQCKEIILDGTDVSKAIVDFVIQHNVGKLVLGASSRNAFTRTFKVDVPTSVSKAAPNFCSVYVIGKGKLFAFKPATEANKNITNKEDFESGVVGNQLPSGQNELVGKNHIEEPSPSRPIYMRSAMPNNVSSSESDEEGCSRGFCQSIKLPDQEGHANYSFLSTTSRPSTNLTYTDQQGNHFYWAYPGRQIEISHLPNVDNECTSHDPHQKYLGFSQPSSYDSTVTPGYNVKCLPPIPSEECRASTSKHLTEDMEAEMRHLNLEMKQKNGDTLTQDSKELPLGTINGEQMIEGTDHMQSLTEGREQISYAFAQQGSKALVEFKVKRRTLGSLSSGIQYSHDPEAELSSEETLEPKHKLLPLESFRSDMQRGGRPILEETDQNEVQPKLKYMPSRGYAFRNHRKLGPVIEETELSSTGKVEPKYDSVPRTIETKRMLQSLPSKFRCRIYTPEEILNATEYFSAKLKIGEGGYGPVYKATLDHTLVAAKVLHSNITQGMKQFQQEVEVLNNIRHPNMVLLVGACPEYGCLVYEYMPNGSLEDRLFCRSGTPPLSWQLRFKIAVDIATGLLFLHQTKPEPFVHRDLKPANILLDHNFVGKIGDVGLARILPCSLEDAATQYRMTATAGTFFYIDPEYQKTGLVGTKSDVYALGVIFLQMITAREAIGLAYNVSDAVEEGRLKEFLDPNVPDWPMQETQKFAELALKCCELRRRDRPDLETVVLPELIRLRNSAMSSEDSSVDHGHQRAASEKLSMRELMLDNDLSQILNDLSVKGASFGL